jgi:hypothetical protein
MTIASILKKRQKYSSIYGELSNIQAVTCLNFPVSLKVRKLHCKYTAKQIPYGGGTKFGKHILGANHV